MTDRDSFLMKQALSLAARGEGRTTPNPLVGCLIVQGSSVVGQGYHERYGHAHAEINALRQAGRKAKGATAYLTLEPCNHWGKTPPCAPELAKAGIKQVVVATLDPNPLVHGRGVRYLKQQGINVTVGVEKKAAEELNRPFFIRMRENRPYVMAKVAMTLDGKIAARSGDSRWVSGPQARRWVHQQRSKVDAILIGRETALLDNPALTSHGAGKNPVRVVIDRTLSLPSHLQLFDSTMAPTIVIAGTKAPLSRQQWLEKRGGQILRLSLKKGRFKSKDILKELFKRNVNQILIEGGGDTLWSFMAEGMVDDFYVFLAPKIVGGQTSPTAVSGAGVPQMKQAFNVSYQSIQTLGSDLLIHARPQKG